MKLNGFGAVVRRLGVVICALLLVPGDALGNVALPQTTQTPAPPADQAAKIPPDQLDSLVAPIALYPDPMLAQVLAAVDISAGDRSARAVARQRTRG